MKPNNFEFLKKHVEFMAQSVLPKVLVRDKHFDLESPIHAPNAARFVAACEQQALPSYLCLQGHPGSWHPPRKCPRCVASAGCRTWRPRRAVASALTRHPASRRYNLVCLPRAHATALR